MMKNTFLLIAACLMPLTSPAPAAEPDMKDWHTVYIPGICTFKAPAKIVSAAEVTKLIVDNMTEEDFQKIGMKLKAGELEEARKFVADYDLTRMTFEPLDQLLAPEGAEGLDDNDFNIDAVVSGNSGFPDGQKLQGSLTQEDMDRFYSDMEKSVRKNMSDMGINISTFKPLGRHEINGTWVMRYAIFWNMGDDRKPMCSHMVTVFGPRKNSTLGITFVENPEGLWYQSLENMISSMDFAPFLGKETDIPEQDRTVVDTVLENREFVKKTLFNLFIPAG